MTSLEQLKAEKRRLNARESLRQHSMERAREKSKLKKEIFAMKNPRLQNLKYHVKGRVGMARDKVSALIEKERKKSKGKKKQQFGALDLNFILGKRK